jgi:hypothetical protein
MTWLKLDDGILSHPKFLRARESSELAFETWVALLAWVKRNLTDGFVPGNALAYLEGTRSSQKRAAAIRALVEAGLLERTPCGGVQLHDYSQWNESAATVKARRKEDATRKRSPAARHERDASSDAARYERDLGEAEAQVANRANTGTYAKIPDGICTDASRARARSETETETETINSPQSPPGGQASLPLGGGTPNGGPEPAAQSPRKDKPGAAEARRVFDAWRELHAHPGPAPKFDGKRQARILARLREGFTTEQLCQALRGALKHSWLMGENPSGRKYDGIQTILRDAEQVELLIALDEGRGNVDGKHGRDAEVELA